MFLNWWWKCMKIFQMQGTNEWGVNFKALSFYTNGFLPWQLSLGAAVVEASATGWKEVLFSSPSPFSFFNWVSLRVLQALKWLLYLWLLHFDLYLIITCTFMYLLIHYLHIYTICIFINWSTFASWEFNVILLLLFLEN